MVLLQNCMGFGEGETGCCIEKCETSDVDGPEAVSIKIEEAVDIKNEMPEAITSSPINTEHEVRLWDVCEVVAVHAAIYSPKKKLKLHVSISCFVLYCG